MGIPQMTQNQLESDSVLVRIPPYKAQYVVTGSLVMREPVLAPEDRNKYHNNATGVISPLPRG